MSEYPYKKYIFETTDREEAEIYLKAHDYKNAFDEVWEKCFRPHFKHGYQSALLNEPTAALIIEELAEIYQSINRELYE